MVNKLIILILCIMFLTGCNTTQPDLKENLTRCIGEYNALNLTLNSLRYNISVLSEERTNCTTNRTIVQDLVDICNSTETKANTSNSYVLGLIRQLKRYERQLENCTFYDEKNVTKELKAEIKACEVKLDKIGDII